MSQEQEERDEELTRRMLMDQMDRRPASNQIYKEREIISEDVIQRYNRLLVKRETTVNNRPPVDTNVNANVNTAANTVNNNVNAPSNIVVTPAGEKAYQSVDSKTGKTVWLKVLKSGLIVDVTEEVSQLQRAPQVQPQPQPQPQLRPARTPEITERVTAIRENLGREEYDELEELEEKLVTDVIEKGLRDARRKLGSIRHAGLVPFDEKALDPVKDQMEYFRLSLRTIVQKGGGETARSREIEQRLDTIERWVNGNISLFLVGSADIPLFFDGWLALNLALKAQRKDMTTSEFQDKYASLKESHGSRFAEKLQKKQDAMYEIYRGIAGIHHGASRNRGEKLENDYEVGYKKVETAQGIITQQSKDAERKRTEFVEKVFSHAKKETLIVNGDFIKEWSSNTIDSNAPIHKGIKWTFNGVVRDFDGSLLRELQRKVEARQKIEEENVRREKRGQAALPVPPQDSIKRETQFVETIGEVWRADDAQTQLQKVFDQPGKRDSTQEVLVGKRRLIDSNLINDLRGMTGKTMWVNGVEWKIDDNTIEELRWSVGSGDSVFIGEVAKVKRNRIGGFGRNEVALLKKTSMNLENVFTRDPTPEVREEMNKKLSLMLDLDMWDRLAESGANVDQLVSEFQERLAGHRVSAINDHFIETERIGLQFMTESADLGWGFDFGINEVQTQENYKRKKSATKIIKRGVEVGPTYMATDLMTAYGWLLADAKNTSKFWPNGMLPMDKAVRKQIMEHEPGWAPWVNKKEKKWRTWYTGDPDKRPPRVLETDVTPYFKMSMLDAVTYSDPTEEMVKLTGKSGKIRPMDLVRKGKRMSELDWGSSLGEGVQYRWFITLSKLATAEGFIARKPDKKTQEMYFGNPETIPHDFEQAMKDFGLGFRDLPDGQLSKFLPFVAAMHQMWRKNMVPGCPRPGEYHPLDERRGTKEIAQLLSGINPDSEPPDFGQKMASSFTKIMDQGRLIGLDFDDYETRHHPYKR